MRLSEALTICQSPVASGAPPFEVFVVCGFTAYQLQTFLTARLRVTMPDHRIIVGAGSYGDLLGNLERLSQSNPDYGVIIMEWSDLDPRLAIRSLNGWYQPDFADIVKGVCSRLERIQGFVEAAPPTLPLAIALPALSLPLLEPTTHAWTGTGFQFELQTLIAEFAARATTKSGVKILSPHWLDRASAPAERVDAKSELQNGFPYTIAHTSALSEGLANLIHGAPPKKGLITDLDHTLWKGILGEVGVANVCWTLETNAHIHGIYQRFLASLADAGVLLAVASKNDAAVVEQAFDRQDLLLDRQAIFPFEVHWDRKSTSVARILDTWNIGQDSVVFVDDSSTELAEVKAAHPGIECLKFPSSPQEFFPLLERLRNLFAKSRISEEDRLRQASIRGGHAMREEARIAGIDPEKFLEEATSVLRISFEKDHDPRVLELVNKTNQFNLNGRRYTETSMRRLVGDPSTFVLKAAYEDKYGPLGKIAVVLGRVNGASLDVETWVMSCRAFSRRIEHACIHGLFEKFGVDMISFDFTPTEKNKPAQEFFGELLGFVPDSPFQLSKSRFLGSGRRWFHKVEEISYA